MAEPDSNRTPQKGWATEVYEFWRLFARLGDTFAGLILAETALLVILGLTAGLTGKDTPPVIGVPVPAEFFKWHYVDVALNRIVFWASFVVLLVWSMTSGHMLFVTRPLLKLLTPVLFVCLQVVCVIPLLILLPFEYFLEYRERTKFAEWLSHPKNQLADATNDEDKNLERFRSTSKSHDPRRLSSALRSWIVDLAKALCSRGIVCIAPFYVQSYAENDQLEKHLRQQLTHAFTRARLRMAEVPAGKYIDVLTLPPTKVPRDPHGARRLRTLLNADVLLWGSWEQLDPPSLWVNIEHRHDRRSAADKESQKKMNERSLGESRHPLRASPISMSSVVVPLDNALDPYLFALIAMLHVLKARVRDPWYVFISAGRIDQLRYTSDQEAALVKHLADEVLPNIGAPVQDGPFSIQPRVWLSRFLSDWIAEEVLNPDFYPYRRSTIRGFEIITDGQALAYCRRLVEVEPANSHHWYRLGALQIVSGKAGMDQIRRAQVIDRESRRHGVGTVAAGRRCLRVIGREPRNNLRMVHCLVAVARALAETQDEDATCQDLWETLLQTMDVDGNAKFAVIEEPLAGAAELLDLLQAKPVAPPADVSKCDGATSEPV